MLGKNSGKSKEQSDSNQSVSVGRRTFSKGIAGTVLGTGLLMNIPSVLAGNAPKEWKTTSTAPSGTGGEVIHGSTLRMITSTYEPDQSRWEHEFDFANHGVAIDGYDSTKKAADLSSSAMAIKDASSDLGVLAELSGDHIAMWPDENNTNDWGEEATLALSAAATLTANAAAATVLTGQQIAERLLAVSGEAGSNFIFYRQTDYGGGTEECGQHLRFIVQEYFCCGLYESVSIRSDVSTSQIDWNIGFTDGTVNASEQSLLGTGSTFARSAKSDEKGSWGNPYEMSPSERRQFGVRKIKRGHVKGVGNPKATETVVISIPKSQGKGEEQVTINGKAVGIARDRGEVFIATNPPIEAEATKRALN